MQSQSGGRWSRWGDLAIEVPAVAVAFAMMVQITANAVMRTYFDSPIEYTLETVQYWYMPVLALLGFMAAQRRGQHIAADLIFSRLPQVSRRPVMATLHLAGAVVTAGLAYYGWTEAVEAFEIRKHAGISPLPAWPVYFLVPVTFVVMTVQFVRAAIDTVRHGVQDDGDEAAVLAELENDDAVASPTKGR